MKKPRSSSSSRRRSRTFSKRTARHTTSRKRTNDQVRSWSTTTTTEFDRLERFWEENDYDRLRRRRKKDREAARVAVGQIRNTAGFEINCEAEKELESMCECSAYYVLDRNPLNSLGLFLKPDYLDINDEEEEALLFRDIHRTKKPYIHMGRSVQHKVEKEEYSTENIKHYYSSDLLLPSCGHATSSPRKDHGRVETLKLRYKDTIRKAQKALGLPEYEKQDGIGLKTTEACSWSNTTTTQKFQEEIDCDRLRRRRERDREAARVAVDGIRDTADLEDNHYAEMELESMCECSSYYVLGRSPLITLGLFLKPEYSDINDDGEAILFGDICRTKKPYINMGRSMQHKVGKQEYGAGNIKHYSSGLLLNATIEATPSCGHSTSSPRKDHDRVETLKLRYKDTIRKAQKGLGPPDYEKQEGISLKTTEACSWSNTTTTESDQFQKFREEIDCDRLRRRRKRDREAVRVAVDGIRDTADLENNYYAEMELESMCECSSYYVLGRSPLITLGLFLKPEYSDINDEEEAILFGDIRRTKKPYIDMGRSMQHKVGKQEYGAGNIKHYSSGLLLNATIEATPSCGHSTSSPRNDHDRVEMLKLRYKDTIRKAQKALGLPDYEEQGGVGSKTTSRRRQYCRSKATINTPIRGATLATSSPRKEADRVEMLKSSMDTILKA